MIHAAIDALIHEGCPLIHAAFALLGSLLLISALVLLCIGWLDDGFALDVLAGTCVAMNVRSTDRWQYRGPAHRGTRFAQQSFWHAVA